MVPPATDNNYFSTHTPTRSYSGVTIFTVRGSHSSWRSEFVWLFSPGHCGPLRVTATWPASTPGVAVPALPSYEHPARATQYIRFLHLCLRPWRKPPEAGYWIQGRGHSIYRLETRQIAVPEGYARSHSRQLRDLDARPGTSSYGSTWSCPFSLTKRILFLNLRMYILLRHSICMAFQGQS